MDHTIINLLFILISGVGVFVALIKFNPPELKMSFHGENLFAVKRDIIESRKSWVFTVFATIGMIIKIASIIFSPYIPQRSHMGCVYMDFLFFTLLIMAFVVWLLIYLSKLWAQKDWLPIIVEKNIYSYKNILTKMEKNESLSESDMNSLDRIEKLIGVNKLTDDPEKRVVALKSYFHSYLTKEEFPRSTERSLLR